MMRYLGVAVAVFYVAAPFLQMRKASRRWPYLCMSAAAMLAVPFTWLNWHGPSAACFAVICVGQWYIRTDSFRQHENAALEQDAVHQVEHPHHE